MCEPRKSNEKIGRFELCFGGNSKVSPEGGFRPNIQMDFPKQNSKYNGFLKKNQAISIMICLSNCYVIHIKRHSTKNNFIKPTEKLYNSAPRQPFCPRCAGRRGTARTFDLSFSHPLAGIVISHYFYCIADYEIHGYPGNLYFSFETDFKCQEFYGKNIKKRSNECHHVLLNVF
jgi:hypothetical protein